MPVRSLDQRILKWPERHEVMIAARQWARRVAENHEDVWAIGYFGSYAREEEGVGSDLDMVIVIDNTNEPFEKRSLRFEFPDLPVPVDLLVYTEEEWERKLASPLADEIRWLIGYQRARQSLPRLP